MDLQRVQNNGDDKCVYACFSPAVAVFNQNISYPDGKFYFIEVCVRSCDGCVRYFFSCTYNVSMLEGNNCFHAVIYFG